MNFNFPERKTFYHPIQFPDFQVERTYKQATMQESVDFLNMESYDAINYITEQVDDIKILNKKRYALPWKVKQQARLNILGNDNLLQQFLERKFRGMQATQENKSDG